MLNFAERFACAIEWQALQLPRIAEDQRLLRQAQALVSRLLARIARSDVIVRSYWADADFAARRYEHGFIVTPGTRDRIHAFHRTPPDAPGVGNTCMHYVVLNLSAPNGYPLTPDEFGLLRAAFCHDPMAIKSWTSWRNRRNRQNYCVLLVAATTGSRRPAMVISIAND